METLKKIISRYMYMVAGTLVILILLLLVYFQITTEQRRACDDAERTISQIESLLEENQKELAEIQKEYKKTCLHNAEIVARIIESNPEVLSSVEELKEIAASVEIDEIHIFNSEGRIFTGTHPQYYGYTFDSGEQMMFFKPMLNDKSLKLVQNITPNTAEEKPMQYSAVWSESGEFIVQVGMEPVNVMKVTTKNELSYIFSLFRVNPEASYYAINSETGEIVGSTNLDAVGSYVSEIGKDFDKIKKNTKGFYTRIDGKLSFCVFKKSGDNYIGRVIEAKKLFERVPLTVFWIFVSLIIVAVLLVKVVVRYMNRYVVMKIDDVNEKLRSIADGNLNERVDIRSSIEFVKLSSYINSMVKSLVDNNKKMSYVLGKTNMHIGTFEYGQYRKRVRYTEKIPQIFSIDAEYMEQLSLNTEDFIAFLNEIKEHSLPGEEGIYQKGEHYLRLEEIQNGDEVFGVAVDVTAEIIKRMEIEKQRDVDALTGLYSRWGLETKLEMLFDNPGKLGCGAMFMVDADGLKTINDTYGHEKGDIYLKKIAQALVGIGTKDSITSRLGGDEFVLLLYGYDGEDEIAEDVRKLEEVQNNSVTALSEDITVSLAFSFGYCMLNGESDYNALIKEADERMYRNKMGRKRMG